MSQEKRHALVGGVSGQDGSYLDRPPLNKGYEIWGSSTDVQISSFSGLHQLGIFDQVKTISMSLINFRSMLEGSSCMNQSLAKKNLLTPRRSMIWVNLKSIGVMLANRLSMS